MKKLLLVVMVVLVAVPVALAAKPATPGANKPTTPGANGVGGQALVAKLTGANANAHVGDHGNVVVRLNDKTLKVCWSYSNLKLTPLGTASATPTASHIHTGAVGVSGGILVPFGASFARRGCSTTTKEIIDGILANPSGYYVNVHNASYPAGAIRGQLKKGAPA